MTIHDLNRRISEIEELNQLNKVKEYSLKNLVKYLKDNKIEFNDLLYNSNLPHNKNYDGLSVLYINDFEDILINKDSNMFMFRYYHSFDKYITTNITIYVDEIKRYIRQIKLKTIIEQ